MTNGWDLLGVGPPTFRGIKSFVEAQKFRVADNTHEPVGRGVTPLTVRGSGGASHTIECPSYAKLMVKC